MAKHETAWLKRTSKEKDGKGGRRGGGVASLLLAGAIAMTGCSAAAADVSFVVSKDVRSEVAALEPSIADGETLSLKSPVAFRDFLAVRQGKAIYNDGESTYALELGQNAEEASPTRLLDARTATVSPDGKLALYQDESGLKLLDLSNGEQRLLLDRDDKAYRSSNKYKGEAGGQFADAAGNYVILPGQVGTIYVIESAAGTVHTIQLDDYFEMVNSSYSGNFSVGGDSLYLFIGGESIPAGIYKIGFEQPGKAEPVMLMEEENKEHSPRFQVMSNGAILYAGEYRQTTGVYVYDPHTGQHHVLQSRDIDFQDDWRRGYAFSLSPDETGLLIHDLEHERVIAGQLSGREWSNERVILEGYEMSAIIPLLTDWDSEAETVYIRLAYDNGSSPGGEIEKILQVKL